MTEKLVRRNFNQIVVKRKQSPYSERWGEGEGDKILHQTPENFLLFYEN